MWIPQTSVIIRRVKKKYRPVPGQISAIQRVALGERLVEAMKEKEPKPLSGVLSSNTLGGCSKFYDIYFPAFPFPCSSYGRRARGRRRESQAMSTQCQDWRISASAQKQTNRKEAFFSSSLNFSSEIVNTRFTINNANQWETVCRKDDEAMSMSLKYRF